MKRRSWKSTAAREMSIRRWALILKMPAGAGLSSQDAQRVTAINRVEYGIVYRLGCI